MSVRWTVSSRAAGRGSGIGCAAGIGTAHGRMGRLVAGRQRAELQRSAAGRDTSSDADASSRRDMLLDAIQQARFAGSDAAESGALRVLAGSERVFTVALFALLAVALLLAILAGTGVYRALRAADGASSDSRLSSGLIANAVHATDAVGSVSIGEGPEGAALVLTERLDSGTYETRFYLHGGSIVQEYALADAPFDPDNALTVVRSDTFDVAYDASAGLLTITTDQGTTSVALRSAGGEGA